MPGKDSHGNIPRSRWKAYEAIKGRLGKRRAAMIAWAGKTKIGRKRMARKAARTRKAHGG